MDDELRNDAFMPTLDTIEAMLCRAQGALRTRGIFKRRAADEKVDLRALPKQYRNTKGAASVTMMDSNAQKRSEPRYS